MVSIESESGSLEVQGVSGRGGPGKVQEGLQVVSGQRERERGIVNSLRVAASAYE